MHQIPEYYEKRISELQAEIDYLHGLLDLAKIPYKKSTKNTDDISGNLEIIRSDKVYVGVENVKPRMKNMIRRMAAFSNPEFYKNMKMGFSTKGIPRIIFCGYDETGYICLPRALYDPLVERLKASDIKYTVEDFRQAGRQLKVSFKGELYREQQILCFSMIMVFLARQLPLVRL